MGMTVVTGASSGIGRSLARRIASSGEPVALLARRRRLLDTLVEEIEEAGGRAIAVTCDVTDRAGVGDAIRRAEAALGPTTRLVANAGGGSTTTVDPFDAERVAEVLELNLMGTVYCIEAVLPGMLERAAGQLVAISSLAGYRGLPAAGAYSAAKAGLTNLMESLRIDLRGRGVDVTVIAPGFVQYKPGELKERNRKKPFRLGLEPATERIWKAIQTRRRYYAFPASLVAMVWLGRVLPASWYDRLLAGRGPKFKPDTPSTSSD